MVIESVNDQYQVRTFLDMQLELSDYLKEAHDEDGVWTISEKKKRLNQGCLAFVSNKAHPLKFTTIEVNGNATVPIREIPTPTDMLKPGRLFIDGFEYLEQTLSEFVNRRQGLVNITEPTSVSLSAITRINFDRFFWWDETKKTFHVNPEVSQRSSGQFYYLAATKLLKDDGDVSDLPINFTHMPASWAAWRLLARDEEHRDRGRQAKADWEDGLKEYERFRSRNIGNKIIKINLDKNVFSNPSGFSQGQRVDLGSAFDRLP